MYDYLSGIGNKTFISDILCCSLQTLQETVPLKCFCNAHSLPVSNNFHTHSRFEK